MFMYFSPIDQGREEKMIFESKRSESDIVCKILVETRKGIKKTQLMYNAKMSNTQLDKYLDKLIQKNFIEEREENGSNTLYYTTDKGEKLDAILQQALAIVNKR